MANNITLNDLNNLINDRRRDSGTNSIDMSTDGFRAINSTLRAMQQFHDWEFTLGKTSITFNKGITWYSAPSDLKSFSDLRNHKPPFDREFDMVSPNNFDSETLKTNRFAMPTQAQTQYVRIDTIGNTLSVHTMSSYDGNGTWAAAGHASNIGTDTKEHFDQPASIKFDYSGTSGTLTVDDMSKVDVSNFVARSSLYINIYFPTVTNFSSVAIKIGSSSSAYYASTSTTEYLGNAPSTGWNIFKFTPWSTTVGSPDDENIDYIQFTFTYGSSTTDTDFRMENLYASENIPLDLIYYSQNMVYDVSGTTALTVFNDAAATTDYPLWTNKWDWVTESFVDATLELIFWMTGEETDRQVAIIRQKEIFADLKRRLPSRRRYAEMSVNINM